MSFLVFILILTMSLIAGCNNAVKPGTPPVGSTVSSQPTGVKSVPLKEGVPFFTDYESGRKSAREKNKPILLFFYTPQCVYSRQMLDETFRNRDVLKLSEQFVCIQIDESQQRPLCEQFDVDATPTIQFMSSDGVLLQRLTAKKRPEQVLHQMNIAIQSVASSQVKKRL
ncbi:MAG: thioredoxin family protein [Thermoguttaceae bacterium]